MRAIAVIGPSQSGKSTLIEGVAGFEGARPSPLTLYGDATITPFEFMGDRWSALEVPGGHDHLSQIGSVLAACDAAVLCVPAQVDAASYGWMRPRTLPLICAAGLGLGGLALALFPGGVTDIAPGRHLRAAAILGLTALALWAMSAWGFPIAAAGLAIVLVAWLGERRLGWIAATVAGVPLFIWLAIEQILGRNLP